MGAWKVNGIQAFPGQGALEVVLSAL